MVNNSVEEFVIAEATPVFDILVEIITGEPDVSAEQPEVVQEIVQVESEPAIEIAQVEPEPKPTEEVAEPEPIPVIEEVQVENTEEEATTADIESTDNNQEGYPIIVKVSHYNPSLGGPNCARFVSGECLSKMSNGERWQDYWGEYNTIACPFELPFGTVILLDENEFTCRDRGGAIIVTYEGYYWIDILAESVPYKYGELKEAYIIK